MSEYNGSIIENGKLTLVRVDEGGIQSRYSIGVRQARRDIRQIEASNLPLADSTKRRLTVLKEAVSLWETQG